jgi:hypothetical protein
VQFSLYNEWNVLFLPHFNVCFNTSVAERPIIHAQPVHSTMCGLSNHHTASEPTLHRQWMNLYPASNLYHAAYSTLHLKVQGKAASYETILPSSKAFAITTSLYICISKTLSGILQWELRQHIPMSEQWYGPEQDSIHRERNRRNVWTLSYVYPLSHSGWIVFST